MTEDSKRSESENAWRDRAIWARVVFTLLFLLILALVAGPLVIVLGIAQGVFTIVTGQDNRNLRDLGAALTEYIREALLFATWNSGRKPFPFAEFPRVDPEEPGESAGGDDAAVAGAGKAEAAKAAASEAEADPDPESAPVASGEPAGADAPADEAGDAPAKTAKPARKRTRRKPAAKKAATGETPGED
ncbi:MAG: DUF4389 domain-containing protein [Gammaproteobacteria bacterium]|nr:DUF4389 domain-containing protein [Gammaproteobacteria bacterium]